MKSTYLYFSIGRITFVFDFWLLICSSSWEARLVNFILAAFYNVFCIRRVSLRVETLLVFRIFYTILDVMARLNVGIDFLQNNDFAVAAKKESCFYTK